MSRLEQLQPAIELSEWVYALLLWVGAAAFAAGLGLALYAYLRNRDRAFSAAALAFSAAGGLALVWAAAIAEHSVDVPGIEVRLDRVRFFTDLVEAGIYALAALTAAMMVVALVLLARWARTIAGPRGIALSIGAPVALLWVTAAALGFVVRELSAENIVGAHPAGTETGTAVSAVTLAEGLQLPTGIAVTPEGDVFIAELPTGRIALVRSGAAGATGEVVDFARIELPENGKLFHLALHPDWPAMPYLYATAHHLVDGELKLALLRLTADGESVVAVDRIVEGLPTDPLYDHFGAAIAICGDAFYVSVGDTDGRDDRGVARRAQLFDRLEGKILRYRLAGAGLEPDGVAAAEPPIFAMGFRNPFSMTCDPRTGFPIVADNGPVGHDQVRLVRPGSNHEWPFTVERDRSGGRLFDSGFTRLGPSGVVARMRDGKLEILLAVVNTRAVYRLVLDEAEARATGLELVYTAPAGIVGLGQGPDGCVYVGDFSALRRLELEPCG
jgi:glucose/arabinose dehydrogenase